MTTRTIFSYMTGWLPVRRTSSVDWIVPSAIGLGVGIAAGIGVGFLLAPATGVETRRQLKNKAMKVSEKARLLAKRDRHYENDFATTNGTNSFLNDVGDIR